MSDVKLGSALHRPTRPSGVALPALQTRSLVDAVYESLWETIVTTPGFGGTVFTEVGIASDFAIARPTAKAVVERLISDGLLVRHGRRGARVPSLSAEDVRDIYRNRRLLEIEANAELARHRRVPIQAKLANQQMRLHAEAGEASEVVASDVKFHRSLVDAAQSPRLSRLHSMIMFEAHFCMGQVQAHRLLAVEISLAEHANILNAIERGDETNAVALTSDHLRRGCDSLIQGMFPSATD